MFYDGGELVQATSFTLLPTQVVVLYVEDDRLLLADHHAGRTVALSRR